MYKNIGNGQRFEVTEAIYVWGCGQPLKGHVGERSEYNNVYIL